jgi:predicted transport protein
MPVFQNVDGKLKKLQVIPVIKEKSLQKLIEDNLSVVLDMNFLFSEYPTTDRGRIDTLAIDEDGAPVIIEYKRNRNDNVINQALSYLKWLKSQKAEFFEMLVIKKLGADAAKRIDWNNPRIICIAESYSKFDIDTLEVIPLNLELYKYHYYDNNVFTLEKVNGEEEKPIQTLEPIIKEIAAVEEKIVERSLEFHLKKGSSAIRELFFILQGRIFELDEGIQERITTVYVGYRVANAFAEIHIQKNNIAIHLRPVEYYDPESKVTKVPDSYRWKLNKRLYIDNENEVDYVMNLIEQSYKDIL